MQSLESKCYSAWEIQKRQIEKSLVGVDAMVLSSYFPYSVMDCHFFCEGFPTIHTTDTGSG
jgi:hypothetical protein